MTFRQRWFGVVDSWPINDQYYQPIFHLLIWNPIEIGFEIKALFNEREPWPVRYGWRLTIRRLRVRLPAADARFVVLLEKIKWKRGWGPPSGSHGFESQAHRLHLFHLGIDKFYAIFVIVLRQGRQLTKRGRVKPMGVKQIEKRKCGRKQNRCCSTTKKLQTKKFSIFWNLIVREHCFYHF